MIYFISFLIAFFRTGYIALSLGLISIIFFYLHKSKSKILILSEIFSFSLILIVFFALATIFLQKKYNLNFFEATATRFETILKYKEIGGVEERFSEIESIISQVLAKRPILGNGLGAEYYALSMSTGALAKASVVTPAYWGIKHYVHNNIFEIFLRTGLLGGFVFLILLFMYYRSLLQFYLKTESIFSQRLLLGIIGVFVSSLALSINKTLLLSPFVWMCAALTYCIAKIENPT
jgi:O-antigen ligase